MNDYSFLLTIGTVFMLGTMSSGPSFILIAKTAMGKSRKEGIGVAIGLGLGAVIFIIIAILGLYAIFFGLVTQLCNPKTAIIIGSILAALLPAQKVYLQFKKYIDRVAGSVLGGLGLKLATDRA